MLTFALALGATPVGTERWIGYQDYPIAALQRHEDGRVGVTFDVTPRGFPEHCVVVSTSRSSALDTAACKAVTMHALFLPALDRDGRFRTAKARMTFVFSLPKT